MAASNKSPFEESKIINNSNRGDNLQYCKYDDLEINLNQKEFEVYLMLNSILENNRRFKGQQRTCLLTSSNLDRFKNYYLSNSIVFHSSRGLDLKSIKKEIIENVSKLSKLSGNVHQNLKKYIICATFDSSLLKYDNKHSKAGKDSIAK